MFAATVRSYFSFPSAARSHGRGRVRPTYAFIDLGTCAEGEALIPHACNDAGAMCVSAPSRGIEGSVRGFIVRGATREPLGAAFGQPPATCVSSDGRIAGAKGDALRDLRAWASHLGVFGEQHWPGAISFARGINGHGAVAGNVLSDAGEFMASRAFLLADGEAKILTPPTGGSCSVAGINDAGQVIFNSQPLGAAADASRAWCWHQGSCVSVGSLGTGRASANAITPEGRIAGWSRTNDGAMHAFLWENGTTRDLGTIGDTRSEALAANDARTVVGRILTHDGRRRAFRWTPDNGMIALEREVTLPASWSLDEAIAINRNGDIVGLGTRRGRKRGFLLRRIGG